MMSNKDRMTHLKEYYPGLCIYVMKKQGMNKELKQYKEKCKTYEMNSDKYSHYIHGYWLPNLEQLQNKGVLEQGKITLNYLD